MLRYNECAFEVVDVLTVEQWAASIVAGRNILPFRILVKVTVPAVANKTIIKWQASRRGPAEDDSSLLVDSRTSVRTGHRQRVQSRYGKGWRRSKRDEQGYKKSLHVSDSAIVRRAD